MNKVHFTLILLLLSLTVSAQKWTANYLYLEADHGISELFSKKTFKDSLALMDYLQEQLQEARFEGYISASIDSVIKSKNPIVLDVFIYAGQLYKQIKIHYEAQYYDILRQVNSAYIDSDFKDLSRVEYENQKIVAYLENNAYPFGKVQLDSVEMTKDTLFAFLLIDRAERITYDTIKVKGNFKISNSFLYGYTGLKPNEAYNTQKVLGIEKLINDLPFAEQIGATELKYRKDKIDVFLPVKSRSNNRFDGILGILPNDKTTGKTVLTGEVNIFLQNVFRSAESINFQWKKLESSSQQLDVDFKIPYIFNTNLGVSAGLNLHKQDSTFLNSEMKTGVQFYYQGQNYVGFQYKNKSSSILSKDTLLIQQFKPFSINSYGLTFTYRSLDYFFNPKRGIDISVEANIGTKSQRIGEDAAESQVQYDGAYKVKWYLPLGKKHTLLIADQVSFLMTDELYKNELYRIGGLNSLRGFLESSIYASTYNIFTLEYRFIFERNSAIFAFFDGAWYEKKLEPYYSDYPLGFGLGLFFKTQAGIFTISYAMGQQENQDINIKNAKIHFGFINKF